MCWTICADKLRSNFVKTHQIDVILKCVMFYCYSNCWEIGNNCSTHSVKIADKPIYCEQFSDDLLPSILGSEKCSVSISARFICQAVTLILKSFWPGNFYRPFMFTDFHFFGRAITPVNWLINRYHGFAERKFYFWTSKMVAAKKIDDDLTKRPKVMNLIRCNHSLAACFPLPWPIKITIYRNF